MEFSEYPALHKVLVTEGLTPLDTLDSDKLLCGSARYGGKIVVKEARGMEETIYADVLPAIQSTTSTFKCLTLPVCHKVVGVNHGGKHHSYLLLKFYEGVNFNQKWDESLPEGFGGRGVEIDMVDKSIQLLSDFKTIDIKQVSRHKVPSFHFQTWLDEELLPITKSLIEANVLTSRQASKVKKILNSPGLFNGSVQVFTNGDFYPRNFIQMSDGKIVVVDWEVRRDQLYRNAPINFLENHLAFLYVHMWGNISFQRKLLALGVQTFNLTKKNFQASILIRSLEQAALWLPYLESGSHLTLGQIQILINSLDLQLLYE